MGRSSTVQHCQRIHASLCKLYLCMFSYSLSLASSVVRLKAAHHSNQEIFMGLVFLCIKLCLYMKIAASVVVFYHLVHEATYCRQDM